MLHDGIVIKNTDMGFYIKEFEARGNGKKPARISFINGCNVIYGGSDNGKTTLLVLLKFWYIYVSKFEETFICKREIDALPPIIRFAVFILLTEPSRIPLFNLLAIELLMAE